MKILVTGATGFIGSHLTDRLVNEGYDVTALVRKTSNTSHLEELNVKLRYGDLTDPQSLVEAVKGIDLVYHLAAYYTFHGKKELYWKVNVEGTRSLLEASLKEGVKHFIYTSTTEAIGPTGSTPVPEDYPPNPTYEYGKSKLAAERLVKEYMKKGLKATIIRPSGVYGPRNINDVAYYFIVGLAKKSPFMRFIVGPGENLIQFVYVEDVVQGFLLAMEKEQAIGQTYHITDEKVYTYNQVYQIVCEEAGVPPPKRHIPGWLAKTLIAPLELAYKIAGKENFMVHVSTVDAVLTNRVYSIEKAKKELGYKPKYDLRKGMKKTIEWYRENNIL